MASSKINEHVVLLGTGANREAVLAAIEEAGGKITHRVGRDTWIVNLDRAEADVAKILPAGARLLRDQDQLPAGLPKSDAMQLRALRLRRTPKFRESKKHGSMRGRMGKGWTGRTRRPGRHRRPHGARGKCRRCGDSHQ